MNKDSIRKNLWHSRKKSVLPLILGGKSVFCQILRCKNQYILIKSVWVAGLQIHHEKIFLWKYKKRNGHWFFVMVPTFAGNQQSYLRVATENSLVNFFYVHSLHFHMCVLNFVGGVVAQSVERVTPGEEVPGSIPAVATRSLLVGSVSV